MTLVAVAGTAALTLLSTGCPEPADLDNPEMYPKRSGTPSGGSAAGGTPSGGSAAGGTPSGGSAAGGTPSGAACETACVTQVLNGCVLCHSASTPLGMLDLATPGYTARMKDQAATHAEAMPGPCPTGDKLIDSANPTESWLLKKVSSQHGTCGQSMPLGSGLMGADLKCMTDYVDCVAGGT